MAGGVEVGARAGRRTGSEGGHDGKPNERLKALIINGFAANG
jgi:hypothetical protein